MDLAEIEKRIREAEKKGFQKPTVRLVGEDGNAFFILGRVSRALRKAGYPELAQLYREAATARDYNFLLAVSLAFIREPTMEGSEMDWEESN